MHAPSTCERARGMAHAGVGHTKEGGGGAGGCGSDERCSSHPARQNRRALSGECRRVVGRHSRARGGSASVFPAAQRCVCEILRPWVHGCESLWVFQGYDSTEIASQIGRPLSTGRDRGHHARKRIATAARGPGRGAGRHGSKPRRGASPQRRRRAAMTLLLVCSPPSVRAVAEPAAPARDAGATRNASRH